MAIKQSAPRKKYYTVAEANATLPLVQAIVRGVAELARDLKDRYERLARLAPPGRESMGEAWAEEVRQVRDDFERDQDRMRDYEDELRRLSVELKDYEVGLIDFPCWMNNREVCLCWKLGEPEVGFWHETDAGFAGRQRVPKAEPPAKPASRLLTSGN
jgi:hypothetical protein